MGLPKNVYALPGHEFLNLTKPINLDMCFVNMIINIKPMENIMWYKYFCCVHFWNLLLQSS